MANNVLEFTDSNLADNLNTDKPVLVDFWATWCGPCKMLNPIVESIAEELGEKAVIGQMDIGKNSTGTQHGLLTIPTMMIFKNGEKVETLTGVPTKSTILEKLEKHM